MLDFEIFRRVVDEAGPSLGRIDFFNYGETFLHKRALEMCEYIKSNFPHIYLYTSTNGLTFKDDQARRLVHSGIDEVTFSIDGATPESYAIYRKRGDFNIAIRNLATAAEEKRKAGRDVPFINWRYILFTHNDSEEEMQKARAMATEIGVDRLSWEITDHPEDMYLAEVRARKPRSRGHQARDLGRQRAGQRDPWRNTAREDRTERPPRRPPAAGASRQIRRVPCHGPQPLVTTVPRPGELRPAAGAPRRAAVR